MRTRSPSNCCVIFFLFLLSLQSVSVGQENQESKKQSSDPFEQYDDSNPFSSRPENETKAERNKRVLESLQSDIQFRNEAIEMLQAKVESQSNAMNQVVVIAIESMKIMFESGSVEGKIKAVDQIGALLRMSESDQMSGENRALIDEFVDAQLGMAMKSSSQELVQACIDLFRNYRCDVGMRNGYQPIDGSWHPMKEADEANASVRARLSKTQEMEFIEYPVIEVFLELKFLHGIEARQTHAVDLESKEFSFQSSQASYWELLDTALDGTGLDYAIDNGKVVVQKIGQPGLEVGQVFHVRGLLSSQLTVEKLVSTVEAAMGSEKLKNISAIDGNRMIAIGSEKQMRKVQKVLGLLAQNGNETRQ